MARRKIALMTHLQRKKGKGDGARAGRWHKVRLLGAKHTCPAASAGGGAVLAGL